MGKRNSRNRRNCRPAQSEAPGGAFLRAGAFGVLTVSFIAALVVLQGGYYEVTSLIVGLLFAAALAVASAMGRRRRAAAGSLALPSPARSPLDFVMPACFLGMCLAMLVSAQANGVPLVSVLHCVPWLVASLFAFAGLGVPRPAARACVDMLGWVGVASGALGVLMASGAVPFPGCMLAGRLQFTFQYANATGMWFSVCALFAVASRDERLRWLSFLPIAGLGLTLSMGSIVVFLAALFAFVVGRVRVGRLESLAFLPISCLLAALTCVTYMLLGGCAMLLAAGFFLLLCLSFAGVLARFSVLRRAACKRWFAGACSVVLVAAAVAGGLVASDRLGQATQTFVERFVQMGDASVLLSSNPVFGVGPGQWRFLYEDVRSADYVANVVHSGYFQVALDGGLIALALLVAGVACGLYAAWRRGKTGIRGEEGRGFPDGSRAGLFASAPSSDSAADGETKFVVALAVAMLLLHAGIDIDFSFSAMTSLMAFLIAIL